MASRPPAEKHLWEFVSASVPPDHDQLAQQPWIIREQRIRLHRPTLETLRDPAQTNPSGIVLDLTSDTSYEMIIDSKTPGALSTVVLKGRLQKAAHSDIILVIKDTAIAGTIRMNSRTFRIQASRNGEHLLSEIDLEKLPPD